MINIETIDDVKILKELTKNNSDMVELKTELGDLKATIELQGQLINKQNETIKKLSSQKSLTAQEVVDALLAHREVVLPKRVDVRLKIQQVKTDNDYFEIPKSLFRKGMKDVKSNLFNLFSFFNL